MLPSFTYYTIIGRDPELLEGHLKNITDYAGFNRLECEKRLLVIVYRNGNIPKQITDRICQICNEYGAVARIYNEPDSNFITNLYACWNLGYELASDGLVFRGGSDQIFSKDSIKLLYDLAVRDYDSKVILQANTIENADRNLDSRHFLAALGDSFDNFDYRKFESIVDSLADKNLPRKITIDQALQVWGKPTPLRTSLGVVDRVDGCSWLMKRKEWKEFGPLPAIEHGITGDVIIHDRLQANGYQFFIVRDCITYHFVRGESKDIQ